MTRRRRSDARIEQLARLEVFRGCPRKDLERAAALTYHTTLVAGSVLCRQGAFGRQAYVIVDGEAVVSVDGTPVAVVGPGAVVGEMSALDQPWRSATVTATTPMTVLVVATHELNDLLHASPVATRNVLVALSARLRRTDAAVDVQV